MGCWSKGLLVFLLSCSLLGCGISGSNAADKTVVQEEQAPLRLEIGAGAIYDGRWSVGMADCRRNRGRAILCCMRLCWSSNNLTVVGRRYPVRPVFAVYRYSCTGSDGRFSAG